MALLRLVTRVEAPIELCFDLSRDLDLHLRSMAGSMERIVGGRASGLIDLGEEVEWEGRHFGVRLRHRSRIVAFDRPRHFRDSMVSGRFARYDHDHHFEPAGAATIMTDVVDFASPLGFLGGLVDGLFLRRYLEALLRRRNVAIKHEAERR